CCVMNQDSPNRAQIEYWNGPAAARWVNEQERLDRVLAPIDELGVTRAAPMRGERVIEIGCGCGASTLRLAERVGQSGSVLGADVSKSVLERARERTRSIDWVDFLEADAAQCTFAGDADLLYSRFGVMFFAEPEAAFANLRRALRRTGRLCF